MPPKLSVIILTRNKTQVLESCIKSVAWADELKIDEKDDKETNFALRRNLALTTVKYDWVLFLDSDEILESSEVEIRALLSELEKKHFSACRFFRQDVFLQKRLRYGELWHHQVTRLLKKELCQYQGQVHEEVKVAGAIFSSNIVIAHLAHQTCQTFWQKICYYSHLVASDYPQISQPQLIVQMIIWPLAKFGQNYFLRLGFLDGYRGLVYALFMTCHSFLVRVFIYENQLKKS